jgi:hypothetical protein
MRHDSHRRRHQETDAGRICLTDCPSLDRSKLLPLLPQYAFEPGTAAIPTRRDTGTFWIVLVLSVVVHVVALFFVPPLNLALRPAGDPDSPLAVELRPSPPAPKAPASVPKPSAIPPAAVAPPAAPARRVPAPKAAPPAKPPPRPAPAATPAAREPSPRPATPSEPSPAPIIASTKPGPELTPPMVQPQASVPERAAPSRGGDLSSYIEGRRRARDAPPSADTSWRLQAAQPAEDAQRDRIAAANLGVGQVPAFGRRKEGGGLFQITRLHYSNAEFVFFGWNKDIRRNTQQTVEVRKGEHSDIRIAVVRRMISIIREHETGEFLWVSDRLGRNVMLSARPADNAGLEDFLWQEFFDEPRQETGPVGRVQR